MIEKIPFETETITHDGKIMEVQTHASPYDLQVKINELVDAVNELHEEAENNARIRADHEHKIEALQDNQNTYWTDIGEIKAKIAKGFENLKEPETPADPYAEQRKWVGCLCRMKPYNWRLFWDYKILERINENNPDLPFVATDGDRYEICEPIKPDDDIFYKGE